jgi:hypothetical protein
MVWYLLAAVTSDKNSRQHVQGSDNTKKQQEWLQPLWEKSSFIGKTKANSLKASKILTSFN